MATNLPGGNSDKLAHFLEEARQILAAGGNNPANLAKLKSAGEKHGLTKDQRDTAIKTLAAPSKTETPEVKEFRRAALRVLKDRRVLNPRVQRELVALAKKDHALAGSVAREIAEEVARQNSIKVITEEQAIAWVAEQAESSVAQGGLTDKSLRAMEKTATEFGLSKQQVGKILEEACGVETGPRSSRSLAYAIAGFGLVILLAVGTAFVLNRRGVEEPNEPVVIAPPDPAPNPAQPKLVASPPTAKVDAWWDTFPDSNLAATVQELKQLFPQDQRFFDGLANRNDGQRQVAYQDWLSRLPDHLRNPRGKELSSRLLTACFTWEANDTTIVPLQSWLVAQIPQDNVKFPPDFKGEDIERSFWSLQISLESLSNTANRPERVSQLAKELGAAFGAFQIDPAAPPAELKAKAEKMLALRCYRNLVPTAFESVDQVLLVRDGLVKVAPQHLSREFRERIDFDVIAVGLSTFPGEWAKLESLVRSCVDSKDVGISLKIVDLYEQVDKELADKMEPLLATRWNVVREGGLNQVAKSNAIRERLLNPGPETPAGVAPAAPMAPAPPRDRTAKLRDLVEAAQARMGAPLDRGLEVLQETTLLTHAATVACALMKKDAGQAKFDALIARIPDFEPDDSPMGGATGAAPKASSTKQRLMTAKTGPTVGTQPIFVNGQLTTTSPPDPVRNGSVHKVHKYAFKAGKTYTIDMESSAFDTYLRLETSKGVSLAENDDGGSGFNSRIVFTAPRDDTYRIIATTCSSGNTGPYALRIQQSAGFGGLGFGAAPGIIGLGGKIKKGGMAPALGKGLMPEEMVDPVSPLDLPGSPARANVKDIVDLESSHPQIRVAAVKRMAAGVPLEFAPRQAQKLAKYLVSIPKATEMEEVVPSLPALTKSRNLILAVADQVGVSDATQANCETVVSAMLGQPAQFTKEQNWRSGLRQMLLASALTVADLKKSGPEEVATTLRNLYREQGLLLGMAPPELAAMSRPAQILEGLTRHVAALALKQNPGSGDKEFLDQVSRRLQAAQFAAQNDLETTVLLQRIWLKVLTIYAVQQDATNAKEISRAHLELLDLDRQATTLVGQFRDGEEAILRVWTLANNLK